MQIKISKDVSLNDIERYYSQLLRAEEVDAEVDIIIPKLLENNFVGLVPALYQFVFTWVRYSNSGRLLLDISQEDFENLEDIFTNDHLFPIVVFIWNKKPIYNSTGELNIKGYLKEPIASVRRTMLKAKPIKGKKLLLVSIDHFPPSSGLIPSYESEQGFIDNEKNTYRNLKGALDDVLNFSIYAKEAFNNYETSFIGMIHELIKNTDEWGKSDNNNVPLDPNVRGLLVKFYKKRRSTFIEEFRMHKGLMNYFQSEILKENVNNELYFLELSIFDSGIGFVEKFRSEDKGGLSNVQIIKRCLIKHMTSASGLEKDDKGIGLDRILSLLDKQGFLRIKTDDSCVYRNLITHPYRTVDNEKDLELFDWKTQSNENFTKLPKSSGSVITILYPLSSIFTK